MISYLEHSRAIWQIDLLALFAIFVLVVQPVSILLVRFGLEKTHKFIQSFLTLVLIPVFTLFEYQVRTTGWRDIAEESIYYDSIIIPLLPIHMLLACSALICWFFTLADMIKKEDIEDYRPTHKKFGYTSSLLMYLTAISGVSIYYLAFFN